MTATRHLSAATWASNTTTWAPPTPPDQPRGSAHSHNCPTAGSDFLNSHTAISIVTLSRSKVLDLSPFSQPTVDVHRLRKFDARRWRRHADS